MTLVTADIPRNRPAGPVPVALAPLAGITDLPFRRLVARFGASFVVSEMIASREMVLERHDVRAKAELGLGDAETAVQLAGNDPRWMAEAARMVEAEGARVIDINMGCPAKKVTKGLAGSALMRTPDLALSLIEAVANAVSVPVTLKTRLGWDDDSHNAPEIARRAVSAGVSRVVIHGRTRCQFYKGAADWGAIRPVVDAVNVSVLANGDITDAATARRALAASGAAGVMIGRGAQGRPWVPAQIAAALAGRPVPDRPRGADLADLAGAHYEAILAFYGPALGLRVARKHLGWYMDVAGTPAALRREVVTAPDPAAVLRRIVPALAEDPGTGGMILDSNLWTSLPVPALLLSPDDTIADSNPAAESFLNLSSRALTGASIWDKVMIDAALEDAYTRARRDRSSLFVNDVDVGSGERPPMQCNIQFAPLTGAEGFMLMMISPREIASRVTQNATSGKAAKSAIGMAEMLAHEIKNPLAGITGAAQLLSMNLANGDLELTDLIVEESRRIVKLLEQVEQFGNLRPPQARQVNIHDVLDRARQSASVGFGAHMHFIEDYDPSLPPTWADGDQLLQVFLNLLKNASEAGQQGGTIRLRSFYEPSLRIRHLDGTPVRLPLQIEVIDDGPGLPPEIAGDVFEPFVSGRENGTGLGLALVSKIVADNGGWVSVDSTPGRTVFRISLPRVPDGDAGRITTGEN